MDDCDFDLVIVGAGPAGSSAAFAASSERVSVALLESEKEVAELMSLPDLDTIKGNMHKSILEVFYSTGLRISELTRIKNKDFKGS